jgi:glycine dehydrogenase subunit 1
LIPDDPSVENLIVLAATELTTDHDIDMLGECLHAVLSEDAA